ncbi:hypothetical protein O6P43_016957 [Quillaja saponaria]|uniref:Uncharacterized protein n=1 Tax=Quillaja saponaria TaxID=32244 RepID=A0AAD7PNE8_QUISA|nr:hypothetical protein O6P43_016957 [Quillaja saponaria]
MFLPPLFCVAIQGLVQPSDHGGGPWKFKFCRNSNLCCDALFVCGYPWCGIGCLGVTASASRESNWNANRVVKGADSRG